MMVHLMALHLIGFAVGLVQAFQLLVGYRHYGAVARMEVHANGIVYDFEILQIGAFRKLILAFHIYIVHQDVLVRTYQREDAGTFYSFFRLLLISSDSFHCPEVREAVVAFLIPLPSPSVL